MADEREAVATETVDHDDLRASLEDAFTEHEKSVADESETGKPAADTRPRDEQGRFTPKSDVPAETAEATPPADGKAAAAGGSPAASPTTREAPSNWQQTDREAFARLAPEAQDFLLRRHRDMEADYTRKTQGAAEFTREYQPVAQMFAPYREQLRQQGMSEGQLIQRWMQAEQTLMQGGQSAVDVLARVVRSYRIDPAQLAAAIGVSRETNGSGAAAPAAFELPPQLRAQLDQLTGSVSQLTRAQQESQQERMNAELGRIDGEIATFRAAPGHEHFAEVEADMARLARAVQPGEPRPSLQQLYEQAVWSNPSTREKLRTAERQSAQASSQQDARAKAEKARRAASSVTGAPGPGQSSRSVKPEGSLRDTIAEAYAAHEA